MLLESQGARLSQSWASSPGVGRILILLAASAAGLPFAVASVRAGWLPIIPAVALLVHGGLAVIGGWQLVGTVRARRELTRRLAALEEETERLRLSVAGAAHDMRAPIVTVSSYLELLATEAFGPLPAAARRAATQAARASSRAQDLVESALTAHVPGRIVAPFGGAAAVELAGVLDDVAASLAAELDATGGTIVIGPLPRLVGSETAYFRIFENLVQNAIRYRRPGAAPRIVVSALAIGSGHEIAVRDEGIGIPEADRERVFQRFVRAADAPDSDGCGIGLATVRELVVRLGGTVWVDPAVSNGTCIRLRLPAPPAGRVAPAARAR